ncbi:YihY/virulence factor BrkB family protein [Spirosoma taeanense]|uniref:YihY/virulence factor BrkB family protein n=1 Tax=Spirosoma taeanense TaxID=2735870 RepID=A0A6M5Y8S7_9BACT|nr:YihY/virulence factor BrkB family protein [Spirosoma taeanense]QJW90698.1 YihY/virulence factor BrkB family protein [Spirosoma taeanense]
MPRITPKTFWSILVDSYNGFTEDRGLKLSAALAYYTVFALAPLLVMIIALASVFFGEEAIQGQIFSEINELVGNEAARQIQEMIKQVQLSGKTTVAVVTSVITLLVGATSVFVEIQDSINLIWRVKAKPKRGWVKLLCDRLLSSSLIISLGFLLVVSLIINGLILALSNRLTLYLPNITVFLVKLVNLIISLGVVTTLFGTIFKVLPDVKISWRDVRWGAIFTAMMFMLGRYLIGLYIETTGTGSTYGAAGSLIVILVWIYYTAAILYFGAEFTQVNADKNGRRIRPAEYAVYVERREAERVVDTLPPVHKQ